jgi:hypothetical protein
LKAENEDLYRRVVELQAQNYKLNVSLDAFFDSGKQAMKDCGLEVA